MAGNYTIQTDAQGRPFLWMGGQVGGRKNFISPAAYGQSIGGNPESAWRSRPQWNQHTGRAENPFKWGKALSMATAAWLGAGGLHAAGAFGGAGGGTSAAGSTAGSAGTAAGAGGTGVAGTSFWSSPWLGPLIGAGTDLLGAGMQARSNNRASDAAMAANAASLAFLKEQDARDFAEYLKERERLWGQQDQDRARREEDRQLTLRREGEREGRLAPFREGAANGYKTLASLLTLPEGGIHYQAPQRGRNLSDLLRA